MKKFDELGYWLGFNTYLINSVVIVGIMVALSSIITLLPHNSLILLYLALILLYIMAICQLILGVRQLVRDTKKRKLYLQKYKEWLLSSHTARQRKRT